jgi:hypothetical protein
MTITALPPPPNRGPTFATEAETFLDALNPFAVELDAVALQVNADVASSAANALNAGEFANRSFNYSVDAAASAASAVSAPGTNATSNTSTLIGTGSKSITIQTGKDLVVGMFLMIASAADPSNYMAGQITAYNSGTGALTVNVSLVGGSGTFADWVVSITIPGAGGFLSNSTPVTVAQGGTGTATPPSAGQIPVASDATTVAWSDPPSNDGGATETTSAVDVALVYTDNRAQAVTMTASGKSVTLPDATTISVGGGPMFVITAVSYGFNLRDYNGGLLSRVDTGKTVVVYLIDKTTSNGVWVARTLGDILPSAGNILDTANTGNYTAICMLSTTKAMLCYAAASGYLSAVILDVSGNTVTKGTIKVVNAVASTFINVDALSSTKAICTFIGASGFLNAVILDVSGSTITNGTVKVCNAVPSSCTAVAALSSTQAICTYAGAASAAYSIILDVSGSTITNGIAAAIAGGFTAASMSVVKMTSTQACVTWKSTAKIPYIGVLNVSGSTITSPSTHTINEGAIAEGAVCVAPLTTTSVLVVINGANMIYAVVGNIVADVLVDMLSIIDINDFGATNISLAMLSSSQAVCSYSVANKGLYTMILRIVGLEISVSSNSAICGIGANGFCDIVKLDGMKSIIGFTGLANYIQSVVIEQSVSL